MFDLLPTRSAAAAANMAVDFLMLQRYPEEARIRFRHYGWQRPAFTFGFSQKLAWVRDQLPETDGLDLCRRPTGGGVVDHRNDWTYSLVIPPVHPWYETRATESYREVHACLAAALNRLGHSAAVTTACADDACSAKPRRTVTPPAGICFQRAERHDVIDPRTGGKIAGAAQKRTRHGLLFQGSVARNALPGIDGEELLEAFTETLALRLQVERSVRQSLEVADEDVEALTEQYASEEWTACR